MPIVDGTTLYRCGCCNALFYPESIAEQGMLVFYTDPGEADIAKADEVQKAQYVASSDKYMASSYGIAAKEMGDDHYYCAYAKRTDGTYVYSQLHSYSPTKYPLCCTTQGVSWIR